ncbi:MAG: hypothetical protein JRI78_12165 [Deltaproteobacteria bacterium]|nr:hypothetical protein [Deltaproteobacteria bacterium]
MARDKLEKGKRPPKAFFQKAVEFFKTFVDKFHHFKEEYLMFGLLSQKKDGAHDGGIGTVLPIPILLWAAKQKNIIGVLITSVMVFLSVYVMRYVLPSYLPAFIEVLFIGGVLGALFLTYVLGEKLFPLKEERHH